MFPSVAFLKSESTTVTSVIYLALVANNEYDFMLVLAAFLDTKAFRRCVDTRGRDSHILWGYNGSHVEVLYNTNQACGRE